MYARRSQAIYLASFFANAKLIWTSTQSACHKNLFSLMVHRRYRRMNSLSCWHPKNTQRSEKLQSLENSPFFAIHQEKRCPGTRHSGRCSTGSPSESASF